MYILKVIRLEKLKYKSTYQTMAENYKNMIQFSMGNRRNIFLNLFDRNVSRFRIILNHAVFHHYFFSYFLFTE